MVLNHKFVEYIPSQIAEGILYVSMEFATAVHNCCCGCGGRVVTPFSPVDWRITYDGDTVSLFPSIGNWNFECQSHYWIHGNSIEWADRFSREKIDNIRMLDQSSKREYYNALKEVNSDVAKEQDADLEVNDSVVDFWGRLKRWLFWK